MTTAEKTVKEAVNYDPVALAESFATAADKSAKLLGEFVARQPSQGRALLSDELGLTKAFLELTAKMLSNPYRLAERQLNLWWDYSALFQPRCSSSWDIRPIPSSSPLFRPLRPRQLEPAGLQSQNAILRSDPAPGQPHSCNGRPPWSPQ